MLLNKTLRNAFLVLVFLSLGLALIWTINTTHAQEPNTVPWITGNVYDKQNQPVINAHVVLTGKDDTIILAESITQEDGRYTLAIPEDLPEHLTIHIERAHFKDSSRTLSEMIADGLRLGKTLVVPDLIMERQIEPAFWVATIIFVVVLILIATGIFHNTLSALIGASLLYLISYLGHPISEGLFIFDFETSLKYIDWNVIFLIMGIMIVIAVVENTGIFQWLAFFAYRISGGRMWLLLPVLMLFTGIASAFLDNVTTMLLMTPITVQIAISLGINPLALLMPEIFASNVIGVSTLVGTPTNILIGSYGKISFNKFLQNLTPGVLLALIGGVAGFVAMQQVIERIPR